MALYKVNGQKLEQVQDTSFINENMLERRDLQKLLISNLSSLGDDLFLLSEEYSEWDVSSRRIDLLCLDKKRRLVVVEIKRTDDGGHMELQAVRYAAMVSSMTLDQAIAAHHNYLTKTGAGKDAQALIMEFLGVDSLDEIDWPGDDPVRIILASADFSQEITTSVLWLNKCGLNITCIRLKPYSLDGNVLIDVAPIIPLPETSEYETKIRAQVQESRKVQTERGESLIKFWTQFIERSKELTPLFSGRTATKDQWISVSGGRAGFSMGVSLTKDHGRVECYIRDVRQKDRDEAAKWSKAVFYELEGKKDEIEKVFGGALIWDLLPERIGSRICWDFDCNWRADEDSWPEIQKLMLDGFLRLKQALEEPIKRLRS